MNEIESDRRSFLVKSVGLVAGSVLGSATLPLLARGQEHRGAPDQDGSGDYVMASSTDKRCGTCEFWGGPRRLSSDGKTITITGLGWCNNAKSPMFQKTTTPDHGLMDSWKKWGAVG